MSLTVLSHCGIHSKLSSPVLPQSWRKATKKIRGLIPKVCEKGYTRRGRGAQTIRSWSSGKERGEEEIIKGGIHGTIKRGIHAPSLVAPKARWRNWKGRFLWGKSRARRALPGATIHVGEGTGTGKRRRVEGLAPWKFSDELRAVPWK